MYESDGLLRHRLRSNETKDGRLCEIQFVCRLVCAQLLHKAFFPSSSFSFSACYLVVVVIVVVSSSCRRCCRYEHVDVYLRLFGWVWKQIVVAFKEISWSFCVLERDDVIASANEWAWGLVVMIPIASNVPGKNTKKKTKQNWWTVLNGLSKRISSVGRIWPRWWIHHRLSGWNSKVGISPKSPFAPETERSY